jgi:(p)ppGpp synthase/HD superfamily hydrolase
MDTSFLDKAIVFAVQAHAGTPRRGKDFPYIVHPLEAMSITATMTGDQELLAAAVLHDVVEDTDYTVEDLKKKFGPRVAELVAGESDSLYENQSEAASWHVRKQEAIDRIKAQSREAQMVALGDKLSNMRAIYRDYHEMGDKLWQRFHVTDVAEHAWHYRGLAASLAPLAATEAYKEFVDLMEKVFGSDVSKR